MKIPDLDKEKISYGKYYYFDNNTYTVDASGSEAELEYLCSDFTITKVIYNEDTQNFKYEMFLETPNGEKEVTVRSCEHRCNNGHLLPCYAENERGSR